MDSTNLQMETVASFAVYFCINYNVLGDITVNDVTFRDSTRLTV